MVRTRGGSRLRPRVRFSTPEREASASAPTPTPVPAPVPSPVPEVAPKEPKGFRHYQTRMGPRAPSPVPQRRVRRARPSKRASTSGSGESSSSRPQPSPVPSAAEATSSPQMSPASRIRRPLFVGNPIPGNARLHRREFHQESYYDVPALRADPRYRESMRLIEEYSLLPFMTPRQHYYPRVVLQFYHSMTSRGADGPLELQLSIDDRPGVLRPADISAALGLRIPLRNSEGYRAWAHPTSQGDGLSTGQRCYSWSSILQEAAPASDDVDRPLISYELIPSAALWAEEGSHLGGSVPDLEEILVQPL